MKAVYPKFLLLALICVIASIGCKKESTNTSVSGVVIDTIRNRPAANQKVVVVSCYQGNFLPVCGDLVASTTTNSRGEFEMSFRAPANPLGYEIRAGFDSTYYYVSSASEKVIPLQHNSYTLYARNISFLKASLQVNNPFDRLVISAGNSNYTLYGMNIDTTLYFKILPKAEIKVSLSVWDAAIGKLRGFIDTLQIGLADTTHYVKQIPDTRALPIR